jgi:hypothetical protein
MLFPRGEVAILRVSGFQIQLNGVTVSISSLGGSIYLTIVSFCPFSSHLSLFLDYNISPKMAPLSSKLPEIMAQITQAMSESFEKMAETLFVRVQNQGKELLGEVTKEVSIIKSDVEDVRKDVDEVKKEVIKAQPVPAPVPQTEFVVPHERNPKFVGRAEELGRLFEMWMPGRKGRIAVVGLGGVG